jgi:hypothetical protein
MEKAFSRQGKWENACDQQRTSEENIAVPRRHLLEKEPISKLAMDPVCRPRASSIRRRFENGAAAFEQKA